MNRKRRVSVIEGLIVCVFRARVSGSIAVNAGVGVCVIAIGWMGGVTVRAPPAAGASPAASTTTAAATPTVEVSVGPESVVAGPDGSGSTAGPTEAGNGAADVVVVVDEAGVGGSCQGARTRRRGSVCGRGNGHTCDQATLECVSGCD